MPLNTDFHGSCCVFRSEGHFIEKLNLNGDPKTAPAFDVLLLKMTDELVRMDDAAVKRQVENARVRCIFLNLRQQFTPV